MKHYTMSQFKKDGYTIPNLPDGITIEINQALHSWEGNRVYFKVSLDYLTTNYPNSEVTEHIRDHFEDPDGSETVTFLSIYGDQCRFRDANTDICHLLGLITRKHYEAGRSALDGLYYKFNEPKYYFKNGKLKETFWKSITERMAGRGEFSAQSLKMIEAGIDILKAERPDADNLTIRNEFWSRTYVNIHYGEYSQKFFPNNLSREYKLGNGYVKESYLFKPTDYGFIPVPDRDNHWMLPDQVYYNGRVYEANEIEFCTCPACNRNVISAEMVDDICKHCYDEKYKIHSYSTRVPTLLKFRAKNVKPRVEPVYYGIELEYETEDRDRAKKEVINLLDGHAILKSDGSIRNGFEIVTCPATADIHKEVFKNFYDHMPTDLKTAANVGMHIHISRKPLNTFTIGKMTEFLNRDDNKAFIKHVAGREPNNYCRQDNRTVTYPLYDKGDRYNTLNLNPPETVEMRIFSTPRNYEEFASRLQFAEALTTYCGPAQLSCSLKELTKYSTFMSWVGQHRKDYPELAHHLKGI